MTTQRQKYRSKWTQFWVHSLVSSLAELSLSIYLQPGLAGPVLEQCVCVQECVYMSVCVCVCVCSLSCSIYANPAVFPYAWSYPPLRSCCTGWAPAKACTGGSAVGNDQTPL